MESVKNEWNTESSNLFRRCHKVDSYILQYKLLSKDYEDFFKRVSKIVYISNEEVFKRFYWPPSFNTLFIKMYSTLYSKEKVYLNYLNSYVGLKITKKKLNTLVHKWN